MSILLQIFHRIKYQFFCEKENGSGMTDGQTIRPIMLQNMSIKTMNGFTFG